MNIGSVVAWIVCGFVVGMCARIIVPAFQRMSLSMTALLGIAGALVGGFLYSVVQGASADPFSLVSHNWYGWIVAILGAVLLLWIYPYFYPRRWWT